MVPPLAAMSRAVSIASPESWRSSMASSPNALRVAAMLYSMNGVSFTCSFGVTTSRWTPVATSSPPSQTMAYSRNALMSSHVRFVKTCASESSAPKTDTPDSSQRTGRLVVTSA